jgi:CheY-like chemotaxis protein
VILPSKYKERTVNHGSLPEADPTAKTVLVVEDDVEVRHLLACALRVAGYTVHEAVDALEALRLLRSSIPFDAVVTDVQMPGEIDGILLAETIRVTHPTIKIVVASGLDLTERLRNSGITFLRKPYGPLQMLDCLKGLQQP